MSSTILLHLLAKLLMTVVAVGVLLLLYNLLRGYRLHRPFWLGPPSGMEHRKDKRVSPTTNKEIMSPDAVHSSRTIR